MGIIHEWGVDSQYTIKLQPDLTPYVLKLTEGDLEASVRDYIGEDGDWYPDLIVAPDKGNSRDNSITAAYSRRLVHDEIPVVVTIRGATRRERMDFLTWLMENDYIPAFPRFSQVEGSSLPMNRHQLIAELRETIEHFGPWSYALPNWIPGEPAQQLIEAIEGNWEAFLEQNPGRIQVLSRT